MKNETSKPLSRQHWELVENAAEDLRFFAANSGVAATQHNLRYTSTRMREFAGGAFRDAWHFAGLEGQPTIKAERFDDAFTAEFALLGGAFLPDEGQRSHSDFPVAIVRNEKEKLASEVTALQFFAIGGNLDANWVMGAGLMPVVPWVGKIDEFWNQAVIISNSIKLGRRTIINYIANTRGGSHSGKSCVSKEHREKYEQLDFISSGNTVLGRDATFYTYMTIVFDLVNSPDVQTYLDRVEQLKKDRGGL